MAGGAKRANLALGGGGIRGIGVVGAIEVLDQAGFTFPRVLGTSAGALVATFIAAIQRAGQPMSTLTQLLDSLDYARIGDASPLGRIPVIGDSLEVVSGGTLYQGRYLRSFVTEHLANLGVYTFADLKLPTSGPETADAVKLAESQKYRLGVTVTDLTNRRGAALPWDLPQYGLDPDSFSVADAALASSAIPFVFPAFRLNAPAGASMLVDGGVLDDVPIATMDATAPQPPPWPTFSVSLGGLVPPGVVKSGGLLGGRFPAFGGPGRVVDEVVDLVETLLAGGESRHVADPCTVARSITVDGSGISPLDFNLSPAQRQKLMDSGRTAAEQFLATWDFEAWLGRCGGPG